MYCMCKNKLSVIDRSDCSIWHSHSIHTAVAKYIPILIVSCRIFFSHFIFLSDLHGIRSLCNSCYNYMHSNSGSKIFNLILMKSHIMKVTYTNLMKVGQTSTQ